MIAFAFGAVFGIFLGGAITIYALWKNGIISWDDR